jgi:hypothetical protein
MASVADDTAPGKESEPASTETTSTETERGIRATSRRPRRRPSISAKQVAHGAKVGTDVARARIASIVRLAALLCGIIVAVAALLIALADNVREANPVVEWLTGVASALAGPFGDVKDDAFSGGVFDLGTTAKDVLTNWGVAAVLYFIAGRVADRIIRP